LLVLDSDYHSHCFYSADDHSHLAQYHFLVAASLKDLLSAQPQSKGLVVFGGV
jgi:hypothetical protein